MKLTLLLLVFLCASSFAQVNDTSDPVEYSRAGAFTQANAGSADLLTGLSSGDLSPQEFKDALYPFAEDFYVSGYISLAQSQAKKLEIDQCFSIATEYNNASGDARDALRSQRNSLCGAAANFQGLASNAPACVQAGALLAGAQCCGNTVLGTSETLEAALTGKKTNEVCAAHAECRSKICNFNDGAPQGTCAPTLTCFTAAPLNGECSTENPNCQSGVCREVDLGLESVQCKPVADACTQNEQCCSGKCASNKCVEKFICTDCVREGEKPTGGKRCCAGLYQPSAGEACTLEFPPFILPNIPPTAPATSFLRLILNALLPSAHAQDGLLTTTNELGPVPPTKPPGNFKATPVTNDNGLTRAQLDLIETAVKDCLGKTLAQRKECLLKTYANRKKYLAENNATRAQGQKLSETFTPEEYVQRYNIPAITPKNRSDVNNCQFNTAKDNWMDASNLQRNGELFLRAFEVSYSGKGTQDFWHLPNASGAYNKDNIYTRTKNVMKMLRENRNLQKDQLNYMDLMMSCQCMYTFGPEKFSAEQQTFFFQFCTGSEENKICRQGDMQDSLKLADSPEAAYREGKEFPNYVEMYLANLQKSKMQSSNVKVDLDNLDSSAAGINHEEVLVRWLRMRSCNQIDVFIDTEKVDGELQGLVADLKQARKPLPSLTRYWDARLKTMADNKVDKKIIAHFKNDTEKDLLYRGYIDTETKVGQKSAKKPKFLLFLFAALLGGLALGAIGIAGLGFLGSAGIGAVAGVALSFAGGVVMGGGGSSGTEVMDKLIKDFPAPIIETRQVEKKSCMLGLFWCLKYYKILHWPAYSNGKSVENAFPFNKKEERTCDQTAATAAGLAGTSPNNCSGMFKGTQCARTFFRPMADTAIKDKVEFAPWASIMKDKVLMDPVFPEFYQTTGMEFDYKFKEGFNEGFKRGCAAMGAKDAAKKADKGQFLPDLSKYFDANMVFKPNYQFNQERINAYKEAVKRYALCKNLKDCQVQLYDGEHPNPRGFLDIVENPEQAELFANYVYQIHFKWRHMSSNTGIGYPLAYLENYYLALQYNVRLLTTLSIRRGIEFDDAYNKFAEDLAIRRANYQDTSGTYGVTLGGESPRQQVRLNTFFRDLRSFGVPLTSEFGAIGDARGVTTRETVGGGSSSSGRIGSSANTLSAVRRFAARVAADNFAGKNFISATKNTPGAAARTRNAAGFMSAVNSPTATMPSFANSKDDTNYSGIGGSLTSGNGTLVASNAPTSSIGAVDTSNRAGAIGSDSGLMKGVSGFGSGNGSGSDGDGFNGANGSGSGAGGAAGTDAELNDAARLTGMNADEVKGMLDGSEADRRKLEGSENDGLFEKVSKAYMRNLDRVLIRKSGPEKVAPPKKESAGDKEREEIKRIFEQ